MNLTRPHRNVGVIGSTMSMRLLVAGAVSNALLREHFKQHAPTPDVVVIGVEKSSPAEMAARAMELIQKEGLRVVEVAPSDDGGYTVEDAADQSPEVMMISATSAIDFEKIQKQLASLRIERPRKQPHRGTPYASRPAPFPRKIGGARPGHPHRR